MARWKLQRDETVFRGREWRVIFYNKGYWDAVLQTNDIQDARPLGVGTAENWYLDAEKPGFRLRRKCRIIGFDIESGMLEHDLRAIVRVTPK